MSLAASIRELAEAVGGADGLSEHCARRLLAAVLDGGVPELETGAALALLHAKGESLPELLGFDDALRERCFRVQPPASAARPVVLASCRGTRDQPNLTPLLALLLARFGVPVLIHGTLTGGGACAYILRELGVMPSVNLARAAARLDAHRLAFVPTAALAPGLAELLALHGRLGLDGSAFLLARLLDPFGGASLRVIGSTCAREHALLRGFLAVREANALLLESTEGEAFAHPRRRPKLEYFRGGEPRVLFDAERVAARPVPGLPDAAGASDTAAWMRRALAGEAPLPPPLVNEVACCLYGAGYAHDMNEAKAIVAVETGSLAAP